MSGDCLVEVHKHLAGLIGEVQKKLELGAASIAATTTQPRLPDLRSRRDRLIAGVDTAAGAGFLDDDLAEVGERGVEALPDPAGKVLAGGVFEAGDVVEATVIDLVFDGGEGGLEVGEIKDPA